MARGIPRSCGHTAPWDKGCGLVLWDLQCRKQGEVGTPPAPTGALPTAPVLLGLVPLAAAGQEAPALFIAPLQCPAPSSRWRFTKPRGGAGTEVGLQHLPAGQLQTSLSPEREEGTEKRRKNVQSPSLSFVPPSCRPPACRDLLDWTGAPLISPEPLPGPCCPVHIQHRHICRQILPSSPNPFFFPGWEMPFVLAVCLCHLQCPWPRFCSPGF